MQHDRKQLAGSYLAVRQRYEQLAISVRTSIEYRCYQEGIDCFFEHRAKEVEQFVAKADRVGKSYGDPLKDITDLAGVRVIARWKADLPRIREVIYGLFDIDMSHSGSKRENRELSEFGYDAEHFVGHLGPSKRDGLNGLWFEIQVRSVLQDAWGRVSRGLFYDTAMPSDLQRRFYALAAVLELVDNEFDSLREQAAALPAEKVSEPTSRPQAAVGAPAPRRARAAIKVEHRGTSNDGGSRDLLGWDRFHNFVFWASDPADASWVSVTMSGTAASILGNRGIDPDKWIKVHVPELIQRRADDLKDGDEIVLTWADVEALSDTG
jgi:ppGpp synthetase/RelA/SpoT-type nucleotidyltranferase